MKQSQALTILKTGTNVFLTGEPGAGKTYTINQYIRFLNDHDISVAVTASTGIAATHIGGMTIHSWSGIGISKYLTEKDFDRLLSNEKLFRRINDTKVLIIDEVSMLSAETLTMVDKVARTIRNSEIPFGGMQVVLIGDFFQLPPVSHDGEPHFAFESVVWDELALTICYLTEQHRQEDQRFLSLLSAIRKNVFEEEHFIYLESRIRPFMTDSNDLTKLYSHNADVDRINDQKLGSLSGQTYSYKMESSGRKSLIPGLIKGCLSPEELHLKKDAVVMFTKNNPNENYVNGTIGTIVDFDQDTDHPVVQVKSGENIIVSPASWAVEENGKDVARITQIPLRLAWAITIHKSQGMSLDTAVIDLRQVFEYGQGYVALSRVRRLDGVHLLGYNERSLLVHPGILKKDLEFRTFSGKAYLDLMEKPKKAIEESCVRFINKCEGSIKKVKKEKFETEKMHTLDETLRLFEAGKSITDIAAERSLVEGTIISHLEKLYEKGKIELKIIEERMPQKILKGLPLIKASFEKEDTTKLAPIFKALREKYTYNELRLARLCLGIIPK